MAKGFRNAARNRLSSRRQFIKSAALLPLTAPFLQAQDPKTTRFPSLEPSTPQDEVIRLFNGRDLNGLYSWLKDSGYEDPYGAFSVQDGLLRILGEPHGYLATEQAYRDYHLVVEYKWGKETHGNTIVRDSGILLHANGPDGNRNPWMASIECQVAQGCVGDFVVIRGRDEAGTVTIPVTITSNVVMGPDGRPRWDPTGQPKVYSGNQFWWSRHDPEFEELLDRRGRWDVDSPGHNWTRVDCICRGDRITVLVNGVEVNACYDAYPSSGKILLQAEGFEILFRKFELHPLE
jgi:hypothetical protein